MRIAAIPDAPGYFATSTGQIWSSRKSGASGELRRLRPQPHYRTGRLQIVLRPRGARKTELVYRLVARAFLGPTAGRVVNHKNGDPRDNRLANLELVSHGENMAHYRTGQVQPFEHEDYRDG